MEYTGLGKQFAPLVDSGPVDCGCGRDLVVVEIGRAPEEFEDTFRVRHFPCIPFWRFRLPRLASRSGILPATASFAVCHLQDIGEQFLVDPPEESGEPFLQPFPDPRPSFSVVLDLVEKEGADEDLAGRVPGAFLLGDACPDGFLPRLDDRQRIGTEKMDCPGCRAGRTRFQSRNRVCRTWPR